MIAGLNDALHAQALDWNSESVGLFSETTRRRPTECVCLVL